MVDFKKMLENQHSHTQLHLRLEKEQSEWESLYKIGARMLFNRQIVIIREVDDTFTLCTVSPVGSEHEQFNMFCWQLKPIPKREKPTRLITM